MFELLNSIFNDPLYDMRKYIEQNGQNSLWRTSKNSFFSDGIHYEDKEKSYEYYVDVPGFSKDEVKVSINDNYILIDAIKSKDDIYRNEIRNQFTVPENSDTENISAKVENGILNISIPKKIKIEDKTKMIEVK